MIEKLKEYRDLIGLVVFFLGGFFWAENQFPTKIDLNVQMSRMRCQLTDYMSLTQDQIRAADMNGKIQDINQQLNAFSAPGVTISPSMQDIVNQQKADRQQYLDDLKAANTDMQAINQRLQKQDCLQ